MKDKMPPKKKSTQPKKGDQVKQQVSDQDEEVKSQGSEAKHKTKEVEKHQQQMNKLSQNIQKNQMMGEDQESQIVQKKQSQQQKGLAQDQMIQFQQEPIQQIGQENQMQQLVKQDDLEHPFADPTYDVTFKMLFGQKAHENILISFLNSLLDFQGKDKIKKLTIVNSDLIQEDVKAIESAVDVRCKTESGEDISIEMQRRNEDYFLARTQDYMAKLVSSQTMKHDSSKYHLVMNKTYIVIISKARLFLNENKIAGDTDIMYEKTVVPMVKELNQEVPHNKMCWKFFELPRFEKATKNMLVDENHSLKMQWLNFLIKCNDQREIPENINEIIKEGYNIMKMANWDKDQRTMYELSKIKEAYEVQELENKEKQGFEKGKLEGKIKGEINTVKALLENEIGQEKIVPKLKFLQQSSIDFIFQHMEDSASDLYNDHYQDLIGDINMDFQ